MLFELFLGAFGAYIATSGVRSDVSVLKGQALTNYYKIEQTRATIIQMNNELNSRIDDLEAQHLEIYKMTEWVAVLQTMQMKGGKYIGNDIYRVIEKKDTTLIDLGRRIIAERRKGIVYWRNYNDHSEYINGTKVHEFKDNVEFVYNLEGKTVYVKEPYEKTWRETWYYPTGEVQRWKVDDVTKCFDEEGNVTCWLSGRNDLLAAELQREEERKKHMKEIAPKLAVWHKCAAAHSVGLCAMTCEEETGFFTKLWDELMMNGNCFDKCRSEQYRACGSKPI